MRTLATLAIVSAASCLLTATSTSQVTTSGVSLGGKDSAGCFNDANPPTLNNGDRASADIGFSYDKSKHELTVKVTNTSPVQSHPNPVLTDIYFNLPHGAVTGIWLASQSRSGGGLHRPQWVVKFDPDMTKDNNNSTPCFGDFAVHMRSTLSGLKGAIGNSSATAWAEPRTVLGPVTFKLLLSGPGIDHITANSIANSFSWNASKKYVTADARFGGSGKDCDGEGHMSNAGKGCQASAWIIGTPKQKSTIKLCQSMSRDCHGCLAASRSNVPTPVGNAIAPIGLPVFLFVPFPNNPEGNTHCIDIDLPDDPAIRGFKVYMTVVNVNKIGALSFSERFDVQVAL